MRAQLTQTGPTDGRTNGRIAASLNAPLRRGIITPRQYFSILSQTDFFKKNFTRGFLRKPFVKSSKSVHLTLKVLLHYIVKYECLDSFRLKNCCGGIVRNVAYGGVSKVVCAERLYYRFVRSPLARI